MELPAWSISMAGLEYLVFFPFIVLFQVYAWHCYHKNKLTVPVRHMVWSSLFFVYLLAVIEITGPGDFRDIGRYRQLIRPEEINLVPLRWASVFGLTANLLLFMPLGFFQKLLWNRSLCSAAATGFSFSLLIEISQLVNRRSTDIDDLLANTLGAVLGWFLCRFLFHNSRKKYQPCGYPPFFLRHAEQFSIVLMFAVNFLVRPLFRYFH